MRPKDSSRQDEADVITVQDRAAGQPGGTYGWAVADSEEWDERYADPAFLDAHELIQRYLRQELDDVELRQIETAIVSNPRLIDHIEEQRLLNMAFRAEAERLQSPRRVPVPIWRAAVPLAACFLVGIVVLQGKNLALEPPTLMPGADVQSELILQTLRGREPAYTVSADSTLPLRIDVGPPVPGARYRVRLLDQTSGEERLLLEGLAADEEGWLFVRVAAGTAQGIHRLDVSALEEGAVRRFLIDFQ